MHVLRALPPRRSTHRLGAGLAAAAVFTAGLACQGTALAAELDDFPQTLELTPVDLVAAADDVYAVGYVGVDVDEDWVFEELDGYVEAVGSGEKLHLGEGVMPAAISATPDGATLHVFGTDGNGLSRVWTIDTDNLTATPESVALEADQPIDVASGADATYVAWTDWGTSGGGVARIGTAGIALGEGVQPTGLGLLPGEDGTEIVVGTSDFRDDASTVPTLRTIVDGEVGEPTLLGPDDDQRGWILSMDVDEVNRLTYALTVRDMEDGPQEYGINVIGADTDLYVALDGTASSVAVSPDGETVYLLRNGSVDAYDADAIDSYTGENYPPSAYLGDIGSVHRMALGAADRIYVVAEQYLEDETVSAVHALGAPGAPTGLRAVASEWATDTFLATWAPPASAGGTDQDSLTYRLSLRDNAGGVPVVVESFMPEYDFYELTPWHTYTLSVTATNGIFTSAPATTTFTVSAPLAPVGPSTLAAQVPTVKGKARVGKKLTARPGAWTSGTTFTFRWTANGKTIKGAKKSTLKLKRAVAGKKIRVIVTGTKRGYTTVVKTSRPTSKVKR